MDRVLTTSEAVREFGMHPATVLRLILTQRVSAHKNQDGKWLICRVDLERWNATRIRRNTSARQTETHTQLAQASA